MRLCSRNLNCYGWNSFTESHHLHKLARYVTEKPYTMLEGGAAVSNVLREKHVLLIKGIWNSNHQYTRVATLCDLAAADESGPDYATLDR